MLPKPVFLQQWAISFPFPLKIFQNCPAHFNPHFVRQVEFVVNRFSLAPFIPPVGLEVPLGPILQHLVGGPDPPGLEPGDGLLVVVHVELSDPAVDFSKLNQPILVTRWFRAIVWKPDQFRWVQDGCNTEAVLLAWMIPILVVNISFKPFNLCYERLPLVRS